LFKFLKSFFIKKEVFEDPYLLFGKDSFTTSELVDMLRTKVLSVGTVTNIMILLFDRLALRTKEQQAQIEDLYKRIELLGKNNKNFLQFEPIDSIINST
jgi:hypothetical protein